MNLAFIRYVVKMETQERNSFPIFLSPLESFDMVDKHVWQEKITILDQRPSIADYVSEEGFPFATMEERRRFSNQLCIIKPPEVHVVEWIRKLQGRRLLLTEVEKSYTQFDKQHLLKLLQLLYLQGFFSWNASVGIRNAAFYCQRCGYGERHSLLHWFREPAIIPTACASCGRKQCGYCSHCLTLGRAKSCLPLLDWTADIGELLAEKGEEIKLTRQKEVINNERSEFSFQELEVNEISSQWDGELSDLQKEAANKLCQFVQDGIKKEFLLYAVCGAGKTEILFPVLELSLQQQQRILITSPRRDVVIELAPRIKQAFPTVEIKVLHAESDEKYEYADLYLATTHQALRFYHYFDIVILDEEDAFPYRYDPMLSYAVHRALKQNGQFIYLSATPHQHMVDQALRGEIDSYVITERFHGYPLAIPKLVPIGNWRKKMAQGEILTSLLHFIAGIQQQQRFAYLFVPHVRDLTIVQEYLLQHLLPFLKGTNLCIETVHAQDRDRTSKVERFRLHQIHILITTTILERGVTIPYCDVAVLGSDEGTFDTAALIQMAGRTGRKLDDPIGHVTFFPEVKTNAQVEAIRKIKSWNEQREWVKS